LRQPAISAGSTIFVKRPITGTLFSLIGILIVWQVVTFFWQARRGSAPHRRPA
jgi:hypothetical protein